MHSDPTYMPYFLLLGKYFYVEKKEINVSLEKSFGRIFLGDLPVWEAIRSGPTSEHCQRRNGPRLPKLVSGLVSSSARVTSVKSQDI